MKSNGSSPMNYAELLESTIQIREDVATVKQSIIEINKNMERLYELNNSQNCAFSKHYKEEFLPLKNEFDKKLAYATGALVILSGIFAFVIRFFFD